MTKLTSLILMAFGAVMTVTAVGCANKNGTNATMNDACFVSQAQGAVVTGTSNCSYNYNATQGFHTYGSSAGYTAYGTTAIGCSSYQSPVYSDSKGLGCVDNTYITADGTPAIYILSGTTFVTANSAGNLNVVNSGASVLRACDGGDGCPSGQTCRSATGNIQSVTGLGICYF